MMEFILTESEFNEDNTAWNGNRFLMGNGYFGIRGTLEEYTKKQMCAVNMAECTGQEPEPTPDPETEPEPEQEPAGLNPAMLLVVLAVLGGIGALVYFKFIKQKPKTKGSDNLDDYDYGEDEEDEDYEFEAEDETDAGEDEEK